MDYNDKTPNTDRFPLISRSSGYLMKNRRVVKNKKINKNDLEVEHPPGGSPST